jgi:drug/metabolite transporter (DMT)-like permease
METRDRKAILALAAAGTLWGLTVPLSKLSLGWLGPGWLAVARFLLAVPPLALVGRRGLRRALAPGVVVAGAIGFGAVILLQNAGIERTSVTHAALIVGAVPVLVALISAGAGETSSTRTGWGGHALALGGIALVAGAGGGGATGVGDLLMMASAVLSATFIAFQPRLLAGRDPAAVTAVQFATGALVGIPIAALTEGAPALPAHAVPVLAFAALAIAGTVLPFWLFAFGQARVPATLAGTFVNLEPLVGAVAGWLAFGERATLGQVGGGVALLVGITVVTATTRQRAPADQPLAPAEPHEPTGRRLPVGSDRRGGLCGRGERRQKSRSNALGLTRAGRTASRLDQRHAARINRDLADEGCAGAGAASQRARERRNLAPLVGL